MEGGGEKGRGTSRFIQQNGGLELVARDNAT